MFQIKNGYYFILLFLILSNCTSSSSKEGEIIEDDEIEDIDDVVEVSNFVWKNWYLSVPIDRADGSKKATSIYSDDILADNLTSEEKKYFYKNDDGSYTFYTQFTGFTTSGGADLDAGKYCRTELREYWKGVNDTDDNWYMDSGTHEMESTLQVNFCEGNGQTYVAQIHGKASTTLSGSPATVKVQWKNGDIVIEYYVKPDNGVWTSNYDEKITIAKVDNEKFTIKLRVVNGVLQYALICESKSINQEYTDLYDYNSNGYNFDNYFKTGNYFKWNEDYTEAAEVVLYSVITNHY
ncbi:polysaccharide lyase family 7 protein [Polaribacter sp. Asnod1-A03]|uniref:polysaccharide lyase family 7 protein n=1 Tax=Polaribacter sp. Asnod1-A03 TaxID=3160581 RepID=UPI00386AEC74